MPALRGGAATNLAVTERQWVYARKREGQVVVVALNNADSAATLDAPATPVDLPDGTVLLDRLGGSEARVEGGRLRITLPGWSSAVLVPAR